MAKEFFADKITAYLVVDRCYRRYFSGIDIAEGYLIAGENPVYFADARYFAILKGRLKNSGIEARLYTGLDDIKEYLKQNKIKNLGINFDAVTVTEYNKYKSLCSKTFDSSKRLAQIRSVKSDGELENIKKACEITERAYYATIKTLEVGMTELEVKERLEGFMHIFGGEGTAFDSIVAFGKNSAIPHHETGETQLTINSVILIDCGARYNGYCADLTRTVYFGQPKKEFVDRYNAVLSSAQHAEERISSAISGAKADSIARQTLANASLDKYFTHSLGHGVGLEIHEYPLISQKNTDMLLDGMVFTIEPGVYFDGEYGIRIEDTVYLEGGKVKRLFNDSKELIKLRP